MASRTRSTFAGISASPTMIGAVTTLIVIVAVFLAYNANNGLPFVPVYRVSVEVPNAARLSNNNEIRIGGTRVGVVESIEAVRPDDSTSSALAATDGPPPGTADGVVARLNLKLDESAARLPKNSIFHVRYQSAFGIKYLEIIRGEGEAAPEGFTFNGLDDGQVGGDTERATLCYLPGDPKFSTTPAGRNGCFEPQTEFDQIADTFDTKTREAARTNLTDFGQAFTGRGTSLNDAINSLEPLFEGLRPVTRVLIQRDTQLRRFFPELADAARIIAPVAAQQADLFTKGAIAFAAISADPQALQDTISESVLTLETGISVLPRQTPFLRDLATLGRVLRPGVTDLRATLPVLNRAIDVGTPTLAKLAPTNKRLERVLREVNQLVSQPTTRTALQRLGETFDSAKPLVKWLVPAQTVCNLFDYWTTFLPNGLSDRDQVGYTFRQSLTAFPPGVDAPEDGLSAAQSNGLTAKSSGGVFEPFSVPILNAHPYAPTGQKNADCQWGQSGYELGALRVPGQAANNPANGVSDLPGSVGPTTLFYNDDRQREFVDTRNPNRAPETWKGIK
jgi:ABC-type transporter Mla subunit MlaD